VTAPPPDSSRQAGPEADARGRAGRRAGGAPRARARRAAELRGRSANTGLQTNVLISGIGDRKHRDDHTFTHDGLARHDARQTLAAVRARLHRRAEVCAAAGRRPRARARLQSQPVSGHRALRPVAVRRSSTRGVSNLLMLGDDGEDRTGFTMPRARPVIGKAAIAAPARYRQR
jgi:hypothetical protein